MNIIWLNCIAYSELVALLFSFGIALIAFILSWICDDLFDAKLVFLLLFSGLSIVTVPIVSVSSHIYLKNRYASLMVKESFTNDEKRELIFIADNSSFILRDFNKMHENMWEDYIIPNKGN